MLDLGLDAVSPQWADTDNPAIAKNGDMTRISQTTRKTQNNGQYASLLSLATAVPEHEIAQDQVAAIAKRLFGKRMAGFQKLAPVFVTTGIDTRYSVRPTSWFEDDRDWPERTDAFLKGATALFKETAGKALREAGVEAGQVDTIVTISSTGIATPSIEAHVLNDMGFSDTVNRIPIFGLGCAGGVSGLSIASRLAEAQPGSVVLLVVIELCTLSFRKDELTKSNLVATALFGDGAAAAVLSTNHRDALADIEYTGEHTWPQTLNIMGWRIDPIGFGAIFDKSIPHLVETKLRQVFQTFLSINKLRPEEIDRFVFHPGGTKVIAALEAAFGLQKETLKLEREVLRNFGNMSAPTVLFVLKRALENGLEGRSFLSSLGPGFTASFATLRA